MDYLVDSILNYVRKENTNYAILLNGKWGSGKTYFWETVIKHEIENLVIGEEKQKTIYVSLYGLSSLEEINKRIVLESLITKNEKAEKLMSGRWSGKITELAKAGLGVAKSLDIPVLREILDTSINYENLLDFSNTVICFDDLERANINILDLLGYINNFVEHDGAKIIIIGYEDEIEEKLLYRNLELKMLVSSLVLDKEENLQQKSGQYTTSNGKSEITINESIERTMNSLFHKSNEYKRIKEKLIGKTLTLSFDSSNIIFNIINQIKNPDFKTYLLEHLERINRLFKDSQTENIRVLKQGLDDFELIYVKYKESYNDLSEEVLLDILVYTLAASFEIKSGRENSKNLEGVTNDALFSINFHKLSTNVNNHKFYLKDFVERYSFENLNGIRFFPFAEKLVRKGIFDLEKFSKEMNSLRNKMQQTTPLHIRFIRDGFYDMSDEEFSLAKQQAYEKIVKGEVHFVLYFRAFTIFRELIEKELIKKDLSTFKIEFFEGLSLSKESAEYYPNMDTFFIGTVIDPIDQDLVKIKEEILSINENLKTRFQEQQIHALMENLNNDFQKFSYEIREHFFAVLVLDKYPMNNFLQKMLLLSNPNIQHLSLIFKKRYSDKNDVKNYKLYLEKSSLVSLKSEIENFIKNKEKTLKVYFLQLFIEALEKVILQLEEIELEVCRENRI